MVLGLVGYRLTAYICVLRRPRVLYHTMTSMATCSTVVELMLAHIELSSRKILSHVKFQHLVFIYFL